MHRAQGSGLPINEVMVDAEAMGRIYTYCRTNATVCNVMRMFCDQVLAGGLTVTLDVYDAAAGTQTKVSLSEELQRVVNVEWAGIFTRDLLWSFFSYGFAVVNLVDSNVKPGERVPHVVSHTQYRLSFIDTITEKRLYRIRPMEADVLLAVHHQGSRKSLRQLENLQVFIYQEPLVDGSLQAPFAAVARLLTILDRTLEDHCYASYYLAHPVVSIEATRTNPGVVEPAENAAIADNEVGVLAEKVTVRVDDVERDRLRATAQVCRDRQVDVALDAQRRNPSPLGPNPAALNPPYAATFLAPTNQRVGASPMPATNPHLLNLIHTITGTVAAALGIPQNMLLSSHAIHAANADVDMQTFEATIRSMHNLLEPIIQSLYDTVYSEGHRDFRRRVLQQRRARATLHESGYIESGGRPSHFGGAAAKRKRGGEEKEDGEVEEGRPLALGDEYPLKDEEEQIEHDVIFRVSFFRTPKSSSEHLRSMWDANLINYETYAAHTANLVGLSRGDMLDEHASLAQWRKKLAFAKEWLDQDVAVPAPGLDKLLPLPRPEPAAGKSPPKKKK